MKMGDRRELSVEKVIGDYHMVFTWLVIKFFPLEISAFAAGILPPRACESKNRKAVLCSRNRQGKNSIANSFYDPTQ